MHSDAMMLRRPFTTGRTVSSNDMANISDQDRLLALQRQHYLVRQRNISVKQSPVTQKHISLIQLASDLTLSTQVLQTMAGPEQVSMLTMDLTSAYLRLGVVQAYNRLISPAE